MECVAKIFIWFFLKIVWTRTANAAGLSAKPGNSIRKKCWPARERRKFHMSASPKVPCSQLVSGSFFGNKWIKTFRCEKMCSTNRKFRSKTYFFQFLSKSKFPIYKSSQIQSCVWIADQWIRKENSRIMESSAVHSPTNSLTEFRLFISSLYSLSESADSLVAHWSETIRLTLR